MTIRTLVLSGGGGRGAFHAGVYKYLSQAHKTGVDADHSATWEPDIVVGTSIGAVNGAAIVQGISAQALEDFWLSLREHDVQALPPGMGALARYAVNWVLRRSIGVPLPRITPDKALSPSAEESWPPLPILPAWLSSRIIGRWNNLLDTGPLMQTLRERLHISEDAIQNSARTLLISATNVRTGEGVTFSNRPVYHSETQELHRGVKEGITLRRILASCSIPGVYPWTKDEDGELYWDGALVANTPLGAAFDVVGERLITEPMEVVVVMMTPWWERNGGQGSSPAPSHLRLPQDFGETITWTLDWALLASFRVSLRMMRAFNEMAEAEMAAGRMPQYRPVQDVIVAPEQFLPVERIIDYDEPASRMLIDAGYAAAEGAFRAKWGAG